MTNPVKNFNWLKYPYGDCTQWYGENAKLYDKQFGLRGHNGIDIVRKWGERLHAVEDGVIADVKDDPKGYGMHIRMFSKDFKREWTYGHLAAFTVKVGDKVKAGDVIAAMGNTGFTNASSTGNGFWDTDPGYATNHPGTHCHFGLREICKDAKGWSYTKGGTKIRVLNYDNGNKGSIDPLPFFANKKALAIARKADADDSALLWKLASLLVTLKV